MTPIHSITPPGDIVGWRLDDARYRDTWDSGEGAFRLGGRWNTKGNARTVYCSIDPSTAILEVAVHKGFPTLDVVPHIITCFRILNPSEVHVVRPDDVPNPNWLHPVLPSSGQQSFGDGLLKAHKFVLIPSAVSSSSWNLLFNTDAAKGAYDIIRQERFALDTRLASSK